MKRFRIFVLTVLVSAACVGQGAYHDYNEFIIRGGVTRSMLRYGDNVGGTASVSYLPFGANYCGIGWNAQFTMTKDYYSISPFGATATLLTALGYAVSGDDLTRNVLFALAVESMGVYIPVCEYLEFQPYWSLLRLSKWRDEKILITGAFGLAASVYIDRFSITGYGEYTYGYGNADWWGETLSNALTDAEDTYYARRKKPRTPFKGWTFGVTLGFSFNL